MRQREQTVFPGITLAYLDVHDAHLERHPVSPDRQQWEIIHCREGRMECGVRGCLCYLEKGDMLVARQGVLGKQLFFPLRHFHGIVIRFDIQKAACCFSGCLQGQCIDPAAMKRRLLGDKEHCIIRASESVEHLFSELYAVPDSIRDGYCKVKLLELLLFLSVAESEGDHAALHTCTRQQSALAKGVASYLSEHMDEKVTLARLTEVFHASGTQIKNTFRLVYGVSVGNYHKMRKMESAALMLETTGRSIVSVAVEHGYDNGSKFAQAFKAVKGMSPRAYRQSMHRTKNV